MLQIDDSNQLIDDGGGPSAPPSTAAAEPPQRHEVGARARVAELLQRLHAPLADTLLVAERLNVARINIAVAQNARQDLERQPSKLVDLCVAMYYKSPEIAPLAQPANLLEATTGEATTGAGAPTGGAPAGTAMPMEDLAGAVARGAAGAAAIGAARAGTASAAPAGAGAATGAGAAPAARQAIANFAAAL